MICKPFNGKTPKIAPSARIAENAVLVGDVTVGADVSIWYGAVVRGDTAPIVLGYGCNVQDNCVVHGSEGYPAKIGKNVTVGHGAIIHGCTIEDDCLIGMGAVVLNGAQIGSFSIVGAGALVTERKEIPPYSLVVGVPGKVVKTYEGDDAAKVEKSIRDNAAVYRAEGAAQLPCIE